MEFSTSCWFIAVAAIIIVIDLARVDADMESHFLKDPSSIRDHDKEHIYEHLAERIGKKKESEMTPEELQFHYFKLHDYDNNHKLDGAEIVKAVTHYHRDDSKSLPTVKKDEEGQGSQTHEKPRVMTDEELINLVDSVLSDSDLNHDGFIEYAEYLNEMRKTGSD